MLAKCVNEYQEDFILPPSEEKMQLVSFKDKLTVKICSGVVTKTEEHNYASL